MATQSYIVYASVGGTPVTGLTPTVDKFAKVSDGTTVSAPTVTEVSSTNAPGFYKFSYDPATPAVGRVDLGTGNTYDGGRYIPVSCL